MSPRSRRATLCSIGIAAVAGCVETSETTPADDTDSTATTRAESPTVPNTTTQPTPTDRPRLGIGEQFETNDGRAVRISQPAVHPSVVTVEYVAGTHYYERVAAAPNGQYLVFSVSTEGFDLPTDNQKTLAEPIDVPLAVRVGGDRYREPIPVERDRRADRDRIAIPVPVVETTDAAIVWEREDGPSPEWKLEPPVTGALGAAPQFRVESISVPEEVPYGESFPVEITVANRGDRDGRFLTTLGAKQGSLGVPETSWTVAAGERRTVTGVVSPEYFDGTDSVRVVFDWGTGRETRTVSVVRDTDSSSVSAV